MNRQLVEEAKDAVSLLELAREEGLEITGDDGDRGYCPCPFHEDRKPSMMVTHRFAICYASTCGWSGDIIDWVQAREDLDFTSALRKVCERGNLPWKAPTGRDLNALEAHQKQSSYMKLLEVAKKMYHAEYAAGGPGPRYMRERGVKPEIAIRFGVGYCPQDHDTMGVLVDEGFAPSLIREAKLVVGQNNDFPRMAGKLVIPIDWFGKTTNLYGRQIVEDGRGLKHDYLLRHRMCWGWDACRKDERVKKSKTVFGVEGLIDGLVMWSAGIPTVGLFGTKALRSHWAKRMYKHGIRRLVYVPDADGRDGLEAAVKVASVFLGEGIKVIIAPMPEGYDPADLGSQSYGDLKDVVRQGVSENLTAYEFAQAHNLFEERTPSLLRRKEKELVLDCAAYSIGVHSSHNTRDGLSAVVSMYVGEEEKQRDKLNTWASRSRSSFVKAAGLKGTDAEEAAQRLMKIGDEIRRHELYGTHTEADDDVESEIDEKTRASAEKLLKDPDLIRIIGRDIGRMGYVGEGRAKVLMYLIATARLMDDPLHSCIMSQSSTGKSALVNAVAKLMPEEAVCMMSAMSSRALYHLEEDSLVHRWVIMAERSGYDDIADHAVRLLQSEGNLRYLVATKDEASGGIDTVEKKIDGPMAWTETTTDQESDINPENLNRMIVIYLDESTEQTERIHGYQRKMATEKAVEASVKRQSIAEVHQAAQRLLKPGLRVIVPYAEYLEFPSEMVRSRRDLQKVIGLIGASACLHQLQRQQGVVAGVDVVYANVYDYRVAYGLYSALLRQAYAGLPKKAEELLHIVGTSVADVAKQRKIKDPTSITFRRRDVQEWARWSMRAVAKALEPLEEQEILDVKYEGGRGNPATYTLGMHWNGFGTNHIAGMLHPTELEKRWKG